MKSATFIAAIFQFFSLLSAAQPFEILETFTQDSVRFYYSRGTEIKARSISERISKAQIYYQKMLGFKPEITVLILNPEDWPKFTPFPVYGMHHYGNSKTLVLASDDNPFWKSFIPPMEAIPELFREQIKTVYRNAKGELSMEPFFDLLAVHELGHAFHLQGGIDIQRKWLGEMFVNILLHTYIAQNEPALLPALTLFPEMVLSQGTKEYTYTALQDADTRYEELGKNFPRNYGWYQCRWHKSAGKIYEEDGKEAGKKLWYALKKQNTLLSDAELLTLFRTAGIPSLARIIEHWDGDTVR